MVVITMIMMINHGGCGAAVAAAADDDDDNDIPGPPPPPSSSMEIQYLPKIWEFTFSPFYIFFAGKQSAATYIKAEVTLKQIALYSMHKNLSVPKSMEMMHTIYTKTCLSLHTSQNTDQANNHRRQVSCIVIYFTESFDEPSSKSAFEMHHLFLYSFSLVRILECLYANFQLAYGVRISPKASVTTVQCFTSFSDNCFCCCSTHLDSRKWNEVLYLPPRWPVSRFLCHQV